MKIYKKMKNKELRELYACLSMKSSMYGIDTSEERKKINKLLKKRGAA